MDNMFCYTQLWDYVFHIKAMSLGTDDKISTVIISLKIRVNIDSSQLQSLYIHSAIEKNHLIC